MALIDVLPKFRYKPLDLGTAPTRLLPKPAEESAAVPTVIEPIGPTITATVPVATASASVGLAAKPGFVPSAYTEFRPLIEALGDSTVINPQAQAAIIAQMGLEKGWKTPADFNYGNITAGKSWKGPVAVRGDNDSRGKRITQTFRQYGSSNEFMNDYLDLLRRQYPDAYAELHAADFSIDKFTDGLVKGGYAEDPKYKDKIKRVYGDVTAKLNKTN